MAELLDLANCRPVEGPVWCVVVCRRQLAYVAVASGPTSLCRRFLHQLGKEHDMRSSVAKRGPLYLVRVQGDYYVVYKGCVPDLEYRAAHREQERAIIEEGLQRPGNQRFTFDDVITTMGALFPGAIQPQLNWYYFDHKWPDEKSFVLMQGIDQEQLFEFGCAVQHKPRQKVFIEPTPPYRALCDA